MSIFCRETVEYVLKVKSKKSKKGSPQEVSLTVVDTPGLGDTDGDEQDARNLVLFSRLWSMQVIN